MLKNILGFRRSRPDGRAGYSYVADSKDGPMTEARVGEVVRVDGRGPPFIVVDQAPTTAIVARWPGRLWKVSIIEAAAPEDQPYAYARYTRALSVRVLNEEKLATLFGEHGEEVVAILNKAATLDRDLARSLSTVRHADAPAAYDRTFRRWANAEAVELGYDGNLDGTLSVGTRPHGSPIYEGLSVLHGVVFERAKAVDGEGATTIDDEEEYLNEPWSGAGAVLGDAALALGAPEFVSPEDRIILLKALREASTFGIG